jgi:hypothetical protein
VFPELVHGLGPATVQMGEQMLHAVLRKQQQQPVPGLVVIGVVAAMELKQGHVLLLQQDAQETILI